VLPVPLCDLVQLVVFQRKQIGKILTIPCLDAEPGVNRAGLVVLAARISRGRSDCAPHRNVEPGHQQHGILGA
jgi:hypothetical protein